MLFEITDGSVSRGGEPVLTHFSFEIKGTEKIAVVGRNGAGKTTLLETVAGTLEPDINEKNPLSGVRRSRAFTVGVLQQIPGELEETVEQIVLNALYPDKSGKDCAVDISSDKDDKASSDKDYEASGGEYCIEERLAAEKEFDIMLSRFGFSAADRSRKLGTFSGGEQKKILLIRLFMQEPDVLLLDEPTNHLDLESVQWLEEYLRKYQKAVVAVSHDRYFINQFAEVIWEVSGRKLTRYAGNYDRYREQKAADYAHQLKAYEEQQKEIRREKELIERFRNKPRKAAFARSRASKLRQMKLIERPIQDDAMIHTEEIVPNRRGSKWVYECEKLKIGYRNTPHGTVVIRELTLRIRRGQKIGVIGKNGTGKSTFLKTVAGLLPPLSGRSSQGNNIDIAYFDQFSAGIQSDKSVLDWFHDLYPLMNPGDIRSLLAGFLFTGADLGKSVESLSGGEKSRLVLASLLHAKPNFLVLDEPTNNMDIPAMETLESIFRAYQGTILFVSHDRYFLSRVADALLIFGESDGPVQYYPFGYEHYMERKNREQSGKDMDLLRTAEEQRLIDGLRSVPKGESRRLREISTEQATRDWKFELNQREREPAEEIYRQACVALEDFPARQAELQLSGSKYNDEELQSELIQLTEQKEKACAAWTQTLLDWYDLWLETRAGKTEQKSDI